MEWLTLLAIIAGPILAVQAQKWIERATEEKKERMIIFRTLMRTRSSVLFREHVDALNMIPIVFSKKNPSDSDVRRKWEILFNHRLTAVPQNTSEAVQLDFAKKGVAHLTDLLISLAKALNYKFDENDIQRVYSPLAHEKEFAENQESRQLLLRLLRGEGHVNVAISPGNPEAAKQFNELLVKALNGQTTLKFKLESDQSGPATYLPKN
jgi:hypothetical protein